MVALTRSGRKWNLAQTCARGVEDRVGNCSSCRGRRGFSRTQCGLIGTVNQDNVHVGHSEKVRIG